MQPGQQAESVRKCGVEQNTEKWFVKGHYEDFDCFGLLITNKRRAPEKRYGN